jgi:phosphoserine phosphatase
VSSERLLVLFDVDQTLTRDEGIDLIAESVSPEVAREVSAITAAAMRGELDFRESLIRRVAALKGASLEAVREAARAVELTHGVPHVVSVLQSHGHLVGAVSGGFHEMIDPLAQDLNLDFHRANRLEVDNGVLTGNLLGPIIDAKAKADTLVQWSNDEGVPLAQTVAIGDGGNDVDMLRLAGLGIAFMGKPVAKQAADVSIDTPDMAQVLDLLGFIDL